MNKNEKADLLPVSALLPAFVPNVGALRKPDEKHKTESYQQPQHDKIKVKVLVSRPVRCYQSYFRDIAASLNTLLQGVRS